MARCELDYTACLTQARPCFAHKMEYWRNGGGVPGVARPSADFNGLGTINERREDIIRRSRENGYNPEPVGTRWV